MPDYAACEKAECSLSNRCARFLMIPAPERQTFLLPDFSGDDCEHFWSVANNPPPFKVDLDSLLKSYSGT